MSRNEIITLQVIPRILQDQSDNEEREEAATTGCVSLRPSMGEPSGEEYYEYDSDLSEEEIHFSDQDHDSQSDQEEVSDSESVVETCTEFFIGKDNISKWKKTPILKKAKTPQKNIVKITPGPTNYSRDVCSESEAFLKIIDIEMIDLIVIHTNQYIRGLRQKFKRERNCRDTSRSEILGLLGVLFLIGTKKGHYANVIELWDADGSGLEILRAAFSYKRFLFLLRCVRFDNLATRNERREFDKLAAIREFMDGFIRNIKKSYEHTEYCTIDEILTPFRGRCSWIQYIPSKPAKYGIKIFAMSDAVTFYTSNIEVYVGKQPDGQYQASNSPSDIVERLVIQIEQSNRNLTTDNWYSSVSLCEKLIEKKITFLGTMRKNKREIPIAFLPKKNQPVGVSQFGFQKNKTLVSYSTKKNSSVILISSMHDESKIDGKTGKPLMVLDYNKTKGGVGTVNKMIEAYNVSRITKRWPMVLFYAFLNIAGINSQIIYSLTKPSEAPKLRRVFLKNLTYQLMNEHLKSRSKILSLPLDISCFLKRRFPVEDAQEDIEPPTKKKKGRCYICGRKKNTNTTTTCGKCQKFACKKHVKTEIVCLVCCNKEESD